jgi:hypothetical protein
MAEPAKVIDRGALYYPNVHIRDTEWLKATLLCFPSLDRMVPGDYPVADADVPKFFAGQEGRNGRRMLGIRKIDDHETHEERLVLLNRIKEDVEKRDLAARFSESATRREFGEKADAFQIHEYKINGAFLEYLTAVTLAWKPSTPLNKTDNWFAVHPTVGQTILSTNAVALANKYDLEIVTDSGPVHSALLGANAGEVYDIMMRDTGNVGRSDSEKVNDLFRYVIVTEFDLSDLSNEEIVRLNRARGDLATLKSALLKQVDDLGRMPTREAWNDALRARTNDVVQEWTARDSFFSTLRRAPEMQGIVKDLATSIASGVFAGNVVASMTSALPGLLVGVVFAGIPVLQSWRRGRTPYQFLSTLEKTSGVRRRHVLDFSPV